MLSEIIENSLIEKQKLFIEHRDSFYPVFASCEVPLSKEFWYKKVIGKCLKAAYLDCIGYGSSEENTNSLGRRLSQKLGDATERVILNILSDSGTLIEKNIKFSIDSFNINGRLDAIVKMFDTEYGLEIKSLSSSSYVNDQIFGSIWNKKPSPKIEHVLQIIPYLIAFQERISKFILYYIRRDNGDTKEFILELAAYEDDLVLVIDGIPNYNITANKVLGRFDQLKKYLAKNEIPPQDYIPLYSKEYVEFLKENNYISQKRYDKLIIGKSGDFECSNCSYKGLCK